MLDMVNHPPHYTNGPRHSVCGSAIEVIDITEDFNFCLGNVRSTTTRRPGQEDPQKYVEDLEKSVFYINREIANANANANAKAKAKEVKNEHR